MKEHYYLFLKIADGTYERTWMFPYEARYHVQSLARQSKSDVLMFRMVGAVRVEYKYEVTQ